MCEVIEYEVFQKCIRICTWRGSFPSHQSFIKPKSCNISLTFLLVKALLPEKKWQFQGREFVEIT